MNIIHGCCGDDNDDTRYSLILESNTLHSIPNYSILFDMIKSYINTHTYIYTHPLPNTHTHTHIYIYIDI